MVQKAEQASQGDIFILSGEERFQSNRILELLQRRSAQLSLETIRLKPDDLAEISLTAIFNEGSLFSPGKLVILDEVDKIGKKQKIQVEQIISGKSDNILFCRTAGRKPSNKFIKKIESAGFSFTCWEPYANKMWIWTKKLAAEEGITFQRNASQAVEVIASGKLERLADLIARIALFHGEKATVNSEGVFKAVRGSVETSAFQFCDEVLSNNRASSMTSLALLLDSGEEPIRLLALLFSQWKLVARANELLEKGNPSQVVAKQMGLPSFRWKSIYGYSNRSLPYLSSAALESFASADYGLKTGADVLISMASVVLTLTTDKH